MYTNPCKFAMNAFNFYLESLPQFITDNDADWCMVYDFMEAQVGTLTEEQWDEVDYVVAKMRDAGVSYPVWIMPVGATEEDQRETAGAVADLAIQRGINVSARVHCYLWGNTIGV